MIKPLTSAIGGESARDSRSTSARARQRYVGLVRFRDGRGNAKEPFRQVRRHNQGNHAASHSVLIFHPGLLQKQIILYVLLRCRLSMCLTSPHPVVRMAKYALSGTSIADYQVQQYTSKFDELRNAFLDQSNIQCTIQVFRMADTMDSIAKTVQDTREWLRCFLVLPFDAHHSVVARRVLCTT